MKYPNVWKVDQVIKMTAQVSTQVNGQWVPARPMGFASTPRRFYAAWLVWTGRADALVWEGQ